MSEHNDSSRWQRARAMAVHLYTASGALWALLSFEAIFAENYKLAFVWMFIAVVVDASDGPFARWADVKQHAPQIDGARLDDIIDYLNYTVVPIVLLIHAGWLPDPAWAWAAVPLVTSALAFSNTGAKDTGEGFFLGFPSYWNIVAFYVEIGAPNGSEWYVLLLTLALSALSLAPIRFVYPNRIDRFRWLFIGVGVVWGAMVLVIALLYPDAPRSLVWASLVYPALYVGLSLWLDLRARRLGATSAQGTEPS